MFVGYRDQGGSLPVLWRRKGRPAMDTNDLPEADVPAGQAGTASRQDPVEGKAEAESTTPRRTGPVSSQDAVEGEPEPAGS